LGKHILQVISYSGRQVAAPTIQFDFILKFCWAFYVCGRIMNSHKKLLFAQNAGAAIFIIQHSSCKSNTFNRKGVDNRTD